MRNEFAIVIAKNNIVLYFEDIESSSLRPYRSTDDKKWMITVEMKSGKQYEIKYANRYTADRAIIKLAEYKNRNSTRGNR